MPKPTTADRPTRTSARSRFSDAPPIDWMAILRSGPTGVKKWNRLTRAGRKAVPLDGVDLSQCDLSEANLSDASARKAAFVGSLLARARLDGGRFEKADFRDACFARANLFGGHFRGASFPGADLTGVNLKECDLRGAEFADATLVDVTLEGASFDKDTTWPADFVVPGEMSWVGRGTDPRLSGRGKGAVATDINGLIVRLKSLIDPNRMKRTFDMLKSGKNQLFAEVEPNLVRGIVRSQREVDLVYSCVLLDDGTYACCTQDLSLCMGLRGEPCKHLLVLLIGLARAGQIDAAAVDRWVVAASAKNHRWNKKTKNHVSDTLLRYKGAEAGEIDWRPTETIPEDFYAM